MKSIFFLIFGLTGLAAESKIDRLYVFGDSYSDSGAGYVDGDGPTAVVYFAEKLGIRLIPPGSEVVTASSSLNFAVSGAQTGRGGGRKVEGNILGYGMANQVADFLAMANDQRVRFNAATTLFYLAGGLNDSRLESAVTVANLEEEIRQLYKAGARRFAVAILPTAIPNFHDVAVRLNPELERIPAAMRAEMPGIEIRTSAWGRYFDEVMEHPGSYGIENTRDRCAGRAIFKEDATPCAKPGAFYYYHAAHPSTAVHRVVGGKLYDELKGK